MHIRPALLPDITAIASLHVDVWREVYPYIPDKVHQDRNLSYRLNQWHKALTEANPVGYSIAVLTLSDLVSGFSQIKLNRDTCVPNPDFELHACYLEPHLRGTAAGPRMMEYMLEQVIALGGQTCLIWVWLKNPIKLTYFGLGFKKVIERDRNISGHAIPEMGLVHEDLCALLKTIRKVISRYEQSSLAENRLRRPFRQNPICERIGKSPKLIQQPFQEPHLE